MYLKKKYQRELKQKDCISWEEELNQDGDIMSTYRKDNDS